MTIRDPNFEMMQAQRGFQQAQGLGYYQRTSTTVDDGIKAIRDRADALRSNLASIDKWRAELQKLEAVLAAWGDK